MVDFLHQSRAQAGVVGDAPGLGELALADIARDSGDPYDIAGAVGDRNHDHVYPPLLAPDQELPFVTHAPAGFEYRAIRGEELFGEVGGKDLRVGFPNDLGRLHAPALAETPIDLDVTAVRILEPCHVRNAVEQRLVALPGFTQGPFGGLARRYVFSVTNHAGDLGVLVLYRKSPRMDPAQLAVRPDDPVLAVPGLGARGFLLELADHRLPVLGMNRIEENVERRGGVGKAATPDVLEFGAHIRHPPALRLPYPEYQRNGADHQMKLLPGFVKLCLRFALPRHVDARSDHIFDVAGSVGQRRIGPFDEAALAGLAHPVIFELVAESPLPQIFEHRAHRGGFLGQQQELPDAPALDLVETVAGQPLAARVELHDPALAIKHHDQRMGGLNDPRVKLAFVHDGYRTALLRERQRDDAMVLRVAAIQPGAPRAPRLMRSAARGAFSARADRRRR